MKQKKMEQKKTKANNFLCTSDCSTDHSKPLSFVERSMAAVEHWVGLVVYMTVFQHEGRTTSQVFFLCDEKI